MFSYNNPKSYALTSYIIATCLEFCSSTDIMTRCGSRISQVTVLGSHPIFENFPFLIGIVTLCDSL